MQYAIEPIVTVTLPWGTVTSKTGLISVSNITDAVNNIGSNVSMHISLDDTNGIHKPHFDSTGGNFIYGRPCSVSITVTAPSEAPVTYNLINGIISSGMRWDEGSRRLEFDVTSRIKSSPVGYTPKIAERPDTTNPNPGWLIPYTGRGWNWGYWISQWPYNLGGHSSGKPHRANMTKSWPVVFGTAIKVPAVQMNDMDQGTLEADVTTGATSFSVVGGNEFRRKADNSGNDITISVGGIAFRGSFGDTDPTADLFTITAPVADNSNLAMVWEETWYDNSFAARPTKDVHTYDPAVAYLASPARYKDVFLYIKRTDGGTVNHFAALVIAQKGRKLFFGAKCPFKVDEKCEIVSFAGGLRADWVNENGVAYTYYNDEYGSDNGRTYLAGQYYAPAGAVVFDMMTQVHLHICDYNFGSTVKAVYAYRTYKNKRRLEQVPESYYVYNAMVNVGDAIVTGLYLPIAMSRYEGEGWEDQLYVTISSNVLEQNVADAISEILSEYTDLTPDASSFASVASKVSTHPIGFALLEERDALTLCEQMAHQARCALRVEGSTVEIIYLSEYRAPDFTITDSHILADSVNLSYTQIEDIVTKSISNWKEDYTEESGRTYTYIPKGSWFVPGPTAMFGVISKEQEYFIYNYAMLVKMSTDFWGYRDSNMWRQVEFKLPLREHRIRPHDVISLSTDTYVGTTVFVTEVNYDPDSCEILVKAEGMNRMGLDFENEYYYRGDPDFPVKTMSLKSLVVGVKERDFAVPSEAEEPATKSYDILVKNTTGSTIEVGTVWKRGTKNADGSINITDLSSDKDNAISSSQLVIVQTELKNGEYGYAVSPTKGTHKIRYTPTEDDPVKGEFWSLQYPSLGLVKNSKLVTSYMFIAVEKLPDEGSKKFMNVIATPDAAGGTEMVFLQADGDMPANGKTFSPYSFEDFGRMITAIIIRGDGYQGGGVNNLGTFSVQITIGGVLTGPVVTAYDTQVPFNPVAILPKSTPLRLMVHSSSGCKNFAAYIKCYNLTDDLSIQ